MPQPTRLIPAAALAVVLAVPLAGQAPAQADRFPQPTQGDYLIKNFSFRDGESLPEVRMHYRVLGTIKKNGQGQVTNAVLIMHGTGGTGRQFSTNSFAGELFNPGQLLDATQYFIVMPDDIGHGMSAKPSDGLRMKFPKYDYLDMVQAEYRLLTEGLGVNHLRLVMGTSMGGMHTWLWGEEHPTMMDALMPLASLPTAMSGRNRAWRRVIMDAIRDDPEWKGGDYTTQPPSLRTAGEMLFIMSSNPLIRQRQAPTGAKSDADLDTYVANYVKTNDANDVLYAFDSSRDYNPAPKLEQITAPLFAVNSADDLINPPELGILEREVKRVPHGQAVVVPLSEKTAGHGTHTLAAVWKSYLEELLKESAH
ncbi:MAG TPA: alpha/beta fold hydrolase [Vicinamibacterales bacterium]